MLGRKTGGRKRGTPNRVTRDVRMLSNEYTAEAISTLIDLMRHGGEQVRLAAAREMLDRAVGKPAVHAEVRGAITSAPVSVQSMSDEELWTIVLAGQAEAAAGTRGH